MEADLRITPPSLLSYWTNHVQVVSQLISIKDSWGKVPTAPTSGSSSQVSIQPSTVDPAMPWRCHYVSTATRWANSSPSGRLIYSSWNVRYLVGVGTTYSAPSSRRVNICRKGTPPPPPYDRTAPPTQNIGHLSPEDTQSLANNQTRKATESIF